MTIKASINVTSARTRDRIAPLQVRKQPVPITADIDLVDRSNDLDDSDVYETSLSIPMSYRLKQELDRIAESDGVSLASLIRINLMTLVRTRKDRSMDRSKG
jgi:hypothetical protein